MAVIRFLKEQKLTDWIQVCCSILLVLAAFWALFTWRNQKEYEVEILGISNASKHFDTFMNVYAISEEGLSDDQRKVLSEFVKKQDKLIEHNHKFLNLLIHKTLIDNNKEKYRSEHDLMIEHINLVLSTFKKRSDKTLYQFYHKLYTEIRATDVRLEMSSMILNSLKDDGIISDNDVAELAEYANWLDDSVKNTKANLLSIHKLLTELIDF
ncbi:hypothetical protein [Parapedobacter sp. DT-150]|uniref:hypothetical protein n=1 Tax=Parapedobacter sp. DT-150 TaxID=3396162 RepID=UPI003F1C5832